MYKIKSDNINTLFSLIAKEFDLFVPQSENGVTNFGIWKGEIDLKTLKSAKSPKDVFFPQCETLYTCVTEDKHIKITPEELCEKPFVVFGVKNCDLKGFEILDNVFLKEPADSFYSSRRKNGTIISLSCNEPEESCFCKTFGIDDDSVNTDVSVIDGGAYLYWEAKTEKGIELTEKLTGVFEETTESDKKTTDEIIENRNEIFEKLPKLSLDYWKNTDEAEIFNSPIWEKLYKPCLACGTCTFVCPTCQCYDIRDYNTGGTVERFRCWDSCMYSDFTMMAHGNNRKSQMQRFRQRFMHKLVYYPANNSGLFSCTGCGRCVEKCPSSLNIVKVIKAFQGGKKDV